MKSGVAVYLTQSPKLRGNIARVTRDGVWVTWHSFIKDVPESLSKDSHVNVREGSKRMRVFYRWGETKFIGFGTPEA